MYKSNTNIGSRNNGPANINFARFLSYIPTAVARILGSDEYPDIVGTVRFYETAYGTVVFAEAVGLPWNKDDCASPIFGFHIHEGESCSRSNNDFSETGSHYDPFNCPHPYHSGDMPPLMCAEGTAFSAFLTDRFTVSEIIGRTVVIHDHSDDFTTQPSGNSGKKIACGEIVSVRR